MASTSRLQQNFAPEASRSPAVSSALIALATCLTYVVLLAGKFTFERAGLPFSLGIPEWLFSSIALCLIVLPWVAALPLRVPMLAAGVTALVAYQLLSTLWAPASDVVSWTAVDLLALLLTVVVVNTLACADIHVAAKSMLYMAAASGVIYAVSGLVLSGDRVTAFGGGYNVYSRVTALGAVALLWMLATKRIHVGLGWIGVALCLAATVLSGSRGGMVAAVAALAVSFPTLLRLARERPVKTLLAVAVSTAAGAVVFGRQISELVNDRIVVLTLQEGHTSGREALFRDAYNLFLEHPVFGGGAGGYDALREHPSVDTYPHNLFLQQAAEGGIVGVLILAAPLLGIVISAARKPKTPMRVALLSGATIFFVSSMFSGGYYDNRFLWVFLILLAYSLAEVQRPADMDEELW